MFTSDKLLKRHILYNLIGAAFLAVFGAVYEAFSHGVYSYFMIYAFAFPLLLGAIPYTILMLNGKNPGWVFLNLWNSAIAAFSTGSVFAGVLEIYGTTNSLVTVYPIIGCALALISPLALIKPIRSVKE